MDTVYGTCQKQLVRECYDTPYYQLDLIIYIYIYIYNEVELIAP